MRRLRLRNRIPGPSWVRRARPLVLALCSIGLALPASGCGPIDVFTGSKETRAEQVRRAATDALTRNDPAVCDEAFSPGALAQLLGGSIGGAVIRCRDTITDSIPATSAQLDRIRINDAAKRAKLRATPSGGENDGARFEVTIDGLGGEWRLDSFDQIDIYDLQAWRQAQIAALQADGLPAREARCVIGQIIRANSVSAIEDAWLQEGQSLPVGRLGGLYLAECRV